MTFRFLHGMQSVLDIEMSSPLLPSHSLHAACLPFLLLPLPDNNCIFIQHLADVLLLEIFISSCLPDAWLHFVLIITRMFVKSPWAQFHGQSCGLKPHFYLFIAILKDGIKMREFMWLQHCNPWRSDNYVHTHTLE